VGAQPSLTSRPHLGLPTMAFAAEPRNSEELNGVQELDNGAQRAAPRSASALEANPPGAAVRVAPVYRYAQMS